MSDPFETLGLPHDASMQDVKRAFRALALKHHPDCNPGDGRAAERFREVKLAYDAILAMPGGRPVARAPRARSHGTNTNSREIDAAASATVQDALKDLLAALDAMTRAPTRATADDAVDAARWCRLEVDMALALKGHVDPLRDASWSTYAYDGPMGAARVVASFRERAVAVEAQRLGLVELRNLRARLQGLLAVVAGFRDAIVE